MKSINHRFTTLTLAGLLGAATSVSAFAATNASDFKKYDSNQDGKISAQEYQAQGGMQDKFGGIDTNGDGMLSHDEFVKSATPSGSRATPAKPATPATPAMPDPGNRL